MSNQAITLLPTTTANLDNSPLSVTGDKKQGAGYYRCESGLHTIAQYVSNFVGTLEIQVSLLAQPTDADWATIAVTENLDVNTPLTENTVYNITGNYVWVRAVVTDMTHGNIAKVQLSI